MLNEASPNPNVIAIKSLEALQKMADGKATKIIIPSDIQSFVGLATSFKELMKDDKVEIDKDKKVDKDKKINKDNN
ncbi:hypothetical protein SDC9_176268 [bioreactor metagenome]|uniref:Uncharacterized protein n=1 Tax=bioreactor metagenome TaxID=1076179 RepID=A0A645GYW1_9ZZZZ